MHGNNRESQYLIQLKQKLILFCDIQVLFETYWHGVSYGTQKWNKSIKKSLSIVFLASILVQSFVQDFFCIGFVWFYNSEWDDSNKTNANKVSFEAVRSFIRGSTE